MWCFVIYVHVGSEGTTRLGRTYGSLTRGGGEPIRPWVERANISLAGYSENGESGFSADTVSSPIPFVRMDLEQIEQQTQVAGLGRSGSLRHLIADHRRPVIRISYPLKSTSMTVAWILQLGEVTPKVVKMALGTAHP